MATGTITIHAESVDAASSVQASCFPGLWSGCCYGDCNPLLYGRGILEADITLNYTINNSNLLSFSYNSTSYPHGAWRVCSDIGYHIDIDFSTDGTNWTTITGNFANNWTCNPLNLTYVDVIASSLAAGIPAVVLNQSGYIRARMWTQRACPTCGIGDESLPNAFPNDAASRTTEVNPEPVVVDWTATLKYDANGGSGAPADDVHSGIPSSTSAWNFTISSSQPTRSNYQFLGWADSSSATTAQYQPGGTVTVQKTGTPKTIYAVWKRIYDYTITYNSNGGSPTPPADVYPSTDASHTFGVTSTVPTRTNYRFDGWGYNGNLYHSGDTITLQSSNPAITLTAQWTAYWDATLNYDANGGSPTPASQTAKVNPSLTTKNFTITSTTPSWGYYRFLGWSHTRYTDSRTMADVEYVAGDTYTIQKTDPTKTLYAVWMMDYRPGEVKYAAGWKTTDRSVGKCHLLQNGSWVEMRTIDGGNSTGNPPSRRTSGTWKNQYRIGSD